MGGIQSPFFKDHPHSFKKKLFPYGLYILLFIAIFRLYFFPTPTAGGAPTAATAAGEHLLIPTSHPPPKGTTIFMVFDIGVYDFMISSMLR